MLKTFKKTWPAYLFILPNFIGVALFIAFPVVYALYMSFTEYDILTSPKFIGLRNYIDLFTNDDLFWTSVRNTGYYVLLTVPTTIILGLGIAVAMNQAVRGITAFRAALYVPVLVSTAAVAFVWQWIFNSQYGVLNAILEFFGLPSIRWLTDERWAMPALALVSVWKNVGYYAIILFAALQGVPKVLLEAASLDGAVAWRRFKDVTIPMLDPAILFVTVIAVLNSFQVFDVVYLITAQRGAGPGGPGTSTYVYNLHLFNEGFKYFRMGYASAMAYIMFAVLFVVTYIQLRVGRSRASAAYEFA
jgi:multiple sugar transport system permease protein